jgi:aspartate/methionine/tyrosine aminotransferase
MKWNVTSSKGTFFSLLSVPKGYSPEFCRTILNEAHVEVVLGIGS